MTEKISDERLRTLIEKCNSFNWQAPKEHCSYGVGIGELEAMAAELLSLRFLNKRLVENSKALAKSLESEYYDCDNEPCALAYHRELLAELEGNKFESAMKRVLNENKGAWKALADGEEGKGSQPAESREK